MKRGQTEIMGLVIIIILLVFIGLFALKFMSVTDNNALQDTTLSIKVNNLINALTKVEIVGHDFKENVAECCSSNCYLGFEDEIKDIIDESFEGKYDFVINNEENGQKCVNSLEGCTEGISSSKYYLRESGNRYSVRLVFCS